MLSELLAYRFDSVAPYVRNGVQLHVEACAAQSDSDVTVKTKKPLIRMPRRGTSTRSAEKGWHGMKIVGAQLPEESVVEDGVGLTVRFLQRASLERATGEAKCAVLGPPRLGKRSARSGRRVICKRPHLRGGTLRNS